jgi:hypothetical protein
MNLSLRYLASVEGPTKKSIIPYITIDETVSPGCYLAIKMAIFFFWSSILSFNLGFDFLFHLSFFNRFELDFFIDDVLVLLVIVNNGTALFDIEYVNISFLTILFKK